MMRSVIAVTSFRRDGCGGLAVRWCPASLRKLVSAVHYLCPRNLRRWYKLHPHGHSFSLEMIELSLLAFLLMVGGTAVYPSLAFGQNAIDQAGQIAGHGLDGFDASQASAQ